MKLSLKIIATLILLTTFSFCKKDSKTGTTPDQAPTPTPTPETKTGGLSLFFENLVDTIGLDFKKTYVNSNGDTFTVSKFNYFISNVVLTNVDGSSFAEKESYHLVKNSDPGTFFVNIKDVPLGSYKGVNFMIGVDSARNVSGAQTGDLSLTTASDMFWGWNTGYIFFKLEGKSPRSGDPSKNIEYHIGGYSGMNKAQRTVSFEFNTVTANVSSSVSPKIHFEVDLNKVFNGKTKIDFSKPNYFSVTMPNAYSAEIADNYAQMFEFEHIHND